MTKHLTIGAANGKPFNLPLDFVTATSVIYGGKGMGKTNLASVIAEELDAAGERFAYMDPLGVTWGLRHSAGKDTAGLEILVLGGVHGGIPIEPGAGKVVADLVVDERVSVVIDISRYVTGKSWSKGDKIRFVADYTTRLYEQQGEKRRRLLQIYDEAARVIPQIIPHGSPELARCVGAIETATEEGRNVGLGVCFVTQRSARMNKSVSELADVMMAFRTIGPNSMDAVLDWLGEHVEKEKLKGYQAQIRELPVGSALVVSPGFLKHEGLVQVRQRRTFDSSATPKAGARRKTPGPAKKLDISAYKARMAETIEKAKQDDPAELRRQIAALKNDLEKKSKPVASPKVVKVAGPERVKVKTVVAKIEVPVLNAKDKKLLQRGLKELATAGSLFAQAETILHRAAASLQKTMTRVDESNTRYGQELLKRTHQSQPAIPAARTPVIPAGKKAVIRQPTQQVGNTAAVKDGGPVTGPEQRILDVIASFMAAGLPANRPSVACAAGYSPTSSAFKNPCSALKTKDYIVYEEDGTLSLTLTGETQARHPDGAMLNTQELHRRVLGILTGPEQKILKPLLDGRPGEDWDRPRLATAAGYEASNSAFKNPLSHLKTMGFVEYPGASTVRASMMLFP